MPKSGPGGWAEGEEGVQGWGLAGGLQLTRQQVGFGDGVQVEEMGSDGDAEMLLTFSGEGAEGEMSQGEVCSMVIRVG
jgi:hypothetical protein